MLERTVSILPFGHGSDVGCHREHNEDNYACVPELGLWVVADGMGGYEAGEVASAIAIETIVENVRAGAGLKEAMEAAHLAILQAVESGRGGQGMGTTAVALRLNGPDYEIAWVGDSRAYSYRTKLVQLMWDHSFVQHLLRQGAITEEEAATHPQRNVITQALGAASDKQLKVDTVSGTLARGERILLCSDGLYGEVPDKDIQKTFKHGKSEQGVVDSLIAQARDNGGSDNITAVIVRAPDDAPKSVLHAKGETVPFDSVAFLRHARRRKLMAWGSVLLAVVLLGLAAWWGLDLLLGSPVAESIQESKI